MENPVIDNGCYSHEPTWRERLGYRLFPTRRPPDVEEKDGWAPGALSTRTVCVIGRLDRLRLLISGQLVVDTRTQTDVIVNRARTVSACYVLPPWTPKPAPAGDALP